MESLTEKEKQRRFKEGFHEYGAVTCDGCSTTIDLSDADDIEEAREIWNEHVRSNHED